VACDARSIASGSATPIKYLHDMDRPALRRGARTTLIRRFSPAEKADRSGESDPLSGAICPGFCAFPYWRVGPCSDPEWLHGRECQPPEPADILDPTESATPSRSWSKPHRKRNKQNLLSEAKYGVEFASSHEMWGMRPCAEDDVAVFTENREGLIHLKTYKVASSAEGSSIALSTRSGACFTALLAV
jgi:hypothetical protein